MNKGFGVRKGFTLVELLVVIAIIGVLVGLLLPAVQSAREAARRSSCMNNIRQMSLGALNYESARQKWPTSGEGKFKNANGAYVDCMNIASFFTQVLPYIEESTVADRWNSDQPYWSPNNDALASTKIKTFLCPSNGITTDDMGGASSSGVYGQTHYMPVAYVDLSPIDGTRQKVAAYKKGLLTYDQSSTMGSARDGTSKTVIFFEDAGRESQHVGKALRSLASSVMWVKTGGSSVQQMTASSPGWLDGAGNTCPNRWADSDNSSGLSGPPHNEQQIGGRQILNNTKTPLGGSAATCLWTQNNCGPNDEPFSQHPGLVLAGLADGSVRALNDSLDVQVCRRLADPADGEPIGADF